MWPMPEIPGRHSSQSFICICWIITISSRCVVCRDGQAMEMSFDHKPEDEPEMKRIKNAGGKVTPDGRVNGGLNLSRAIGRIPNSLQCSVLMMFLNSEIM